MDWSTFQRALRCAVCVGAAAFAFAACSGSGTTVSPPAPSAGTGTGSGSGTGTGTGSGTGSGTATAMPTATATPVSGGGSTATATPAATPTATPAGSTTGTATPTPAPTGVVTAAPVSSLVIGPQVVNAALGGLAQVGILDPGYSGPIEVTAVGNQIEGTVLSSVLNLQNGVLNGESGTSDVLDIDLAKLLSLGVLGQSGTLLNVCESAQTPPVCQQIALVQNPTAAQIGSNLSSAVITPGTFQVLMLVSQSGALNFTNFMVSSSNNSVTVTNLGNGQYALGAAANATPPISATITATDGMGHTITIPVMVL